MNEEIKEILDKFNYAYELHKEIIEKHNNSDEIHIQLSIREVKQLLDYITNLQQKDFESQKEIMKLKDKLEQQRKEYQDTYKDVRIEIKEKNERITELQQLYENGLKVNQNSHKYITELEMNNAILKEDLEKANDIIEKDRQFYKCRMDEYVDLKKENEKLKQTLHNITINDVEEENTTVLDLINENERLKRERQRLLYNLEKVCEERDEEE